MEEVTESKKVLLVHKDFHSLTQLIDFFDVAYSGALTNYALHIGIASCSKDLEDEKLKSTLLYRKLVYKLQKRGDALYKAKIGKGLVLPYYIIKDGKSKTGFTYYLFISDHNRARGVFSTFMRNSKPYYETTLLSQEDMFEVLDNFEKRFKTKYGKLMFIEGTLRLPSETQRRWEKMPVSYSRKYLEKIANENKGKWSSVVIQTRDQRIRFRIYEDGGITLYYGSLKIIINEILKPILRKIEMRRSLFEEVETNAPSDSTFKILLLEHEKELTKDILFQIKEEFAKRYLVSVLHDGNPYLYMDVIDRKDYSNLTLFATGNTIELIPGRRVTSATLIEIVSSLLNIIPTLNISIKEGS